MLIETREFPQKEIGSFGIDKRHVIIYVPKLMSYILRLSRHDGVEEFCLWDDEVEELRKILNEKLP